MNDDFILKCNSVYNTITEKSIAEATQRIIDDINKGKEVE